MTAASGVRAVRDRLAPMARRLGFAPMARRLGFAPMARRLGFAPMARRLGFAPPPRQGAEPEAVPAPDRTTLLRSMLPPAGRSLEIGPGFSPLLPKAEGFSVETADYTDAGALRMKYRGTPNVDAARIEPVDHVLDSGRSLAEAVGRPGSFASVVASHVIEHTPDMLGFLQSCETLLAPGGVLLLAVPDKRHCFDVLQPLTSTGAVLQAHLDGRMRPVPGAIFDDVAYNAVRGGAIGWAPADDGPMAFFAPLEAAKAAYESARRQTEYRDVHVWRFVPSSFRLIMRDLHEIGAIGLREERFHDSVGNEFYMTLSLSAAGCPVDRLTLAKRAMAEQASIVLA
jgi:SAM-dependent methyltransferase